MQPESTTLMYFNFICTSCSIKSWTSSHKKTAWTFEFQVIILCAKPLRRRLQESPELHTCRFQSSLRRVALYAREYKTNSGTTPSYTSQQPYWLWSWKGNTCQSWKRLWNEALQVKCKLNRADVHKGYMVRQRKKSLKQWLEKKSHENCKYIHIYFKNPVVYVKKKNYLPVGQRLNMDKPEADILTIRLLDQGQSFMLFAVKRKYWRDKSKIKET